MIRSDRIYAQTINYTKDDTLFPVVLEETGEGGSASFDGRRGGTLDVEEICWYSIISSYSFKVKKTKTVCFSKKDERLISI